MQFETQVEKNAVLMSLLCGMDSNSLESVASSIGELGFESNSVLFSHFVDLIVLFGTCHNFVTEMVSYIVFYVIQHKDTEIIKLKDLFLSLVLKPRPQYSSPSRIILFHMLRFLYDKGVYTIDEIFDFITLFRKSPQTALAYNDYLKLVLFFSKEIKNTNSGITEYILKMFDHLISTRFGNQYLGTLLSSESSELEEQIKYGCTKNSILFFTKYDEVDYLQELSAQPEFDIMSQIKSSDFESNQFFNGYFYLINVAAIFGSIKCFRFLLMSISNHKTLLNSSLLIHSIAGGNIDVLRMCHQECTFKDHTNILMSAALACQLDVFSWIYQESLSGQLTENYFAEVFAFASKNRLDHIIDQCLNLGISIDAGHESYTHKTLLHNAALESDLDLIRFCVSKGASANSLDVHGSTPFMYACGANDVECVKEICKIDGIDINILNYEKRSGLHFAAIRSNIDMLIYLINDLKMDYKLVDTSGKSILHYAASSGNVQMITFILSFAKYLTNEMDATGLYPFECALRSNHTEAFEILSNSTNISISTTKWQGLFSETLKVTSAKNSIFLANKLPSLNFEFEYSSTPLSAAIHMRSTELIVAFLHHPGCDPNFYTRDIPPLMVALREGDEEIIQLLLSTGKIDMSKKVDGKTLQEHLEEMFGKTTITINSGKTSKSSCIIQ